MSKRYIFPQQNGERKKAKLDVTISDHNFPLSQNAGPSKENDHADTWGDDNDDEILLLASQACEQAYNDISTLPDYSICMQPVSTSTQMLDPGPSTSKTPFIFKKPSAIPPNMVTTNLKDKCNRISSPMPGITSKVVPQANNNFDLSDDLIFNDKIYKGHDTDHIYRQLLQLQEENAKLKSENGKLLDKCVTKEGEASILRTQLKTCQVAVDNARMERIKAQEKLQVEWTEKMTAANNQMHDLRNQLDFKNLEIISIKERCKMLESNKIKLTQVTVASNDISSSHRNNSILPNESMVPPAKRVKMTSSSAQTSNKAHFLKLHKIIRSGKSNLTSILPLVLEPTLDQHTLLEYNEKLQKPTDSHNKCRIFSTFHRIPSTPMPRGTGQTKVSMSCLYEDLTSIATGDDSHEKYFNILNVVKTVLSDVVSQLELVSQKMTTAFQREMDEKYIEATNTFLIVDQRDLLSGRTLYKEEQGVLARRMTAIIALIIQNRKGVEIFTSFEELPINESQARRNLIDIINRICNLLDTSSCALLYSGLLLSIIDLLQNLLQTEYFHAKIMETVKSMITSRPMPFVSCQLLKLLRRLSLINNFMGKFCPGSNGNLKLDYDQGVLLYKKDSCHLQILLKQVETCLKCIERQDLSMQAASVAQDLIALHVNLDGSANHNLEKRCDCQLILVQVLVYALKICAVMVNNKENAKSGGNEEMLATCRSGIHALVQWVSRDTESASRLAHAEGHLLQLCQLMALWEHPHAYVNMLAELTSTFQSSAEDMTSSFHRQAWLNSFRTFNIAD